MSVRKPDNPPCDAKTIRIVEHSGFFEVLDDVFDIEPGKYTFLVRNDSNKNSSFVIMRENGIPAVLPVAKGDTQRLTAVLKGGNYTFYCPLIPTPIYSLKVSNHEKAING